MKVSKGSLISKSVRSVPSCDLIQHISISAVNKAEFVIKLMDCSRLQLCAVGHLVRLGSILDTKVSIVDCVITLSLPGVEHT